MEEVFILPKHNELDTTLRNVQFFLCQLDHH